VVPGAHSYALAPAAQSFASTLARLGGVA